MKLELPSKAELKDKIPNKEQLEDLFYKGYRVKKSIELLEENIEQREKRQKEISKHKVMIEYRLNEKMIDTIRQHIKAYMKKFKKLFEV